MALMASFRELRCTYAHPLGGTSWKARNSQGMDGIAWKHAQILTLIESTSPWLTISSMMFSWEVLLLR